MERNPPRAPSKRRPTDANRTDSAAGSETSSRVSGPAGGNSIDSHSNNHSDEGLLSRGITRASSTGSMSRRAGSSSARASSNLHGVVIPQSQRVDSRRARESLAAPPPPPPPPSHAAATSSSPAAGPSASSSHSAAYLRGFSTSSSAAPQARGSTYSRGLSSTSTTFASAPAIHSPPPPPPPSVPSSVEEVSFKMPSRLDTVARSHSSASLSTASAVSLATRHKSDARSPRDVNGWIDQLLRTVHGSPTPLLVRRTVLRLRDATSPSPTVDALSVLEKIKRRVQLDAPQYYERPHETISQLHESYSRFVKLQRYDKKGETLMLLYRLMDSTPPRSNSKELMADNQSSTTSANRVSQAPTEPNESSSTPMEVDDLDNDSSFSSSLLTRQSSARSSAKQAEGNGASVPPSLPEASRTTRTELDALEDSFKFAVGIATSKPTPTAAGQAVHHSSRSTRQKTGPRSPVNKKHGTSRTTATEANKVQHTSRQSFGVPEEVLLRDVLYALQAIDSRYVYFDAAMDQVQITRSAGVPTPMRGLIRQLCELGWFYRKISEYLKHFRNDLAFGVVGQSFCHVMNLELADYFRLVTVLSSQIDVDVETKQLREHSVSDLTLRKLLVWVQDPVEKMRMMSQLIDSIDGRRGGALASGIHSHILHGDPLRLQYVQNVMKAVAAPIFRMIRRWVFEGELDDTHNEFFVVANQKVADDMLWTHKYQLNLNMLPSFISMDLARKILVIGKSINFIRQCCGDTQWIMDSRHNARVSSTVEFEDNGVRFAQLSSLETMIEKASSTTNAYLIKTLKEKYHLLDHCRALRRYMLLGQGDFIQYLMDLLRPELSKRAAQVHRHTLTNVLETALNASNAKFESADILARLDVELHRPSPGDTGWDIFSLHYKVPSPINTVMNESTMHQYQQIFHFLWRLKRVDHSLSSSWSKDMHLDHMVKKDFPEIRPLIHKCQLLRSEMIQFTTTLHNYVMFEVLETSWHRLVKDLNAAKDLDELISSHEDYITSIKENGFMTHSSTELLKQLKVIFDTIIKFCRAKDNLYTSAIREVDEGKAQRKAIDARTAQGTWGIPEGDEYAGRARQETFGPRSLIFRQISEIDHDFSTQVADLLELLACRAPNSLQTLSLLLLRFDFNEYYKKKANPAVTEE